MPSDLQVSNIKDLTGSNTGLSIASDGQVTISQNNPSLTLGTNAVFPAGHVIQTITKTATTNSDSTTSSEVANISGDSTGFEQQITITSGNKVLVTINGILSMLRTGGDVGGALGIYVTQSGSTTAVYDQTGGLAQYLTFGYSRDFNMYGHFHISVLHTPSVTNPTYKPYLTPYLSGATRIRCNSGSPFIMILQEIKA